MDLVGVVLLWLAGAALVHPDGGALDPGLAGAARPRRLPVVRVVAGERARVGVESRFASRYFAVARIVAEAGIGALRGLPQGDEGQFQLALG